MNALFDRARAERFAQLLDEANGGRRHHARTRLDDELAELVGTGQQLRAMPVSSVAPEPIFKRDLRAQLMATAQRDGIGVTAVKESRESLRRTIAKQGFVANSAKPRRGAIVIGIAAGTLLLSGVSVASGEAMPGDALYGMKRSTERAQLALAGSDISRGQLYLDFARTRLQEAYAIRANASGFVDAMGDMDVETQQGIRMLVTSAVQQNDTTALDAIDSFVGGQRMLVAQMLDLTNGESREKVTGSLAMLTAVEQRAVGVRSALACGVKPTGGDILGPVPGNCAVTGQVKGQAGPGTGQGQQESKAGQPASPTDIPQSSAPASPASNGTTEKKEDESLLGELGRILGGLLGG